MASSRSKRGSTLLRILLGAVLILVIAIAAGVYFLPALLGTSMGLAIVNSVINTDPQTKIDIQQLDLAWSGTQRIPKVIVDHRNGEVSAQLAIELNGSLIDWALRGVRDFGTVAIGGDVVVHEPKERTASTPSRPPSSSPVPGTTTENILIPEGWNATLDFQTLNFRYASANADPSAQPDSAIEEVKLRNLTGTVSLNSSGDGRVDWSLEGESVVNSKPGSIRTKGSLSGFIADTGFLAPQDAVASIDLNASVIPVRIVDGLLGQEGRLRATVGESLNIQADLNGNLTKGVGNLTFDSDKTSGTLSASFDGRRIAIDKPAAIDVRLDPQSFRALSADTAAASKLADASGTLDLEIPTFSVQLNNDRRPDFSTLKAVANIRGALTNVNPNVADINSLDLASVQMKISTDDATREIRANAQSDIVVVRAGNPPNSKISMISNATANDALTADGVFRKDAAILSGDFNSTEINTSLVDGLAHLDGLLVDALGPMIDRVSISVQPTSLPPDGDPSQSADGAVDFRVTMQSTAASVDWPLRFEFANGLVYDSAQSTEVARITPTPALIARLQSNMAPSDSEKADAAKLRLDEVGLITLNVKTLRYPFTMAPSADQSASANSIDGASFDGRLQINNINAQIPRLTPEAGESSQVENPLAPLGIEFIRLEVQSERLGDNVNAHLHVNGTSELGDFTIGAPIDITGPLSTIGRRVNATLNVNGFADSSVQADFVIAEDDESAEIRTDGKLRLSPSLAGRFASLMANASLLEPAVINYQLKPTKLQRASPDQPFEWNRMFAEASTAINITSDRLFAALPQNAEPNATERHVDLRDLSIEARWPSGLFGGYPATNLSANWMDTNVNRKIASLSASTEAGSTSIGQTRVNLTEVDVERAEQTLGLPPGQLTGWVGRNGSASLSADPSSLFAKSPERTGSSDHESLVINADFDRLQSEVHGRLVEQNLVIGQRSLVSLQIEKQTAQRMLNRSEAESNSTARKQPDEPAPRGRIDVRNDVKVRADINRLRIPRLILTRESRDYSTIDLDTNLAIEPVQISVERIVGQVDSFTLRDLSGMARQSADTGGVEFELTGEIGDRVHWADQLQQQLGQSAQPTEDDRRGAINITGMLIPARSSDAHWKFANLEADLARLPVSFIDAYAHARGVVAATVGRDLNAAVRAENFGPDSGFATVVMQTANGNLNIDSLRLLSTGEVTIGSPPDRSANQPRGDNASKNRYRKLTAPLDEHVGTPAESTSLDLSKPTWAASASLNVTEEMSHLVLQGVNPILYDVQKKTGPVRLGVNYLRYPFSGDLSQFDADVSLDLGQVRVPSKGLLGDLLGTARDQVGAETEGTIPTINIQVQSGLVEYDRLVLQTPQFTIATGGSIDLKTRKLNLLAAVPLIGWQAVFGKMTGPLKTPVNDWSIPFYLVVTGSIDDPEIKPDPNGAERVMEDFFKGAIDQTLGNIFRQIIDNQNSKEDKSQSKDKKKKNDGGG